MYIATDGGLGIIRYEPYTLHKKAAFFEQQVAAGGHKRLGFVHQLYRDGAANGGRWLREISDNDGGHTAHYLAAKCFEYAVTHDEAARREAVDAFEAMSWLQWITGTDGFFARSIWAEKVDRGPALHARQRRPARQVGHNQGRPVVVEGRHLERRSELPLLCRGAVPRSRRQGR